MDDPIERPNKVTALGAGVSERFKVGIARYHPDLADEASARQVDEWWRATFGELWLYPPRRVWLDQRNPCLGDDGPGPWLCWRNGQIVGQQGELPFDLQVGTDMRRAVWALDLHVDPAWRLRGVGPGLVATLLEQRPIVCMLKLSSQGYAAFKGAGCTDLGTLPLYRRVLDPRAVLVKNGVPVRLRKLRGVVGLVGAPAVRLGDAALAAAVRLSGAKLVEVDRFDARVDDVWAASRDAYPVLARRDLQALAWRIDQRPDRAWLRTFYLVRGRRTLGYVVLRPTMSSGRPAMVVVDYLAPPRWVAPLMVAVVRIARRSGAVTLSLGARNVRSDRALRAVGFSRRPLATDRDRQMMVHSADDVPAEVAAVLRDPDAWFVTAADGDLEHGAPPPPDHGLEARSGGAR